MSRKVQALTRVKVHVEVLGGQHGVEEVAGVKHGGVSDGVGQVVKVGDVGEEEFSPLPLQRVEVFRGGGGGVVVLFHKTW